MRLRHLVVGPMRSGTSLLMQLCEASHMPVVRSYLRDRANIVQSDGFRLNPVSLYESDLDTVAESIAFMPNGGAIKVVLPWLDQLPDGYVYRVAWITRDAEELRQEWEAARLGVPPSDIEAHRQRLAARRDVLSVTPLVFHDLVLNPLEAITALQRDGWPVTAEAARVVDPVHYKFRNPVLGVPPHPDLPYLTEGL